MLLLTVPTLRTALVPFTAAAGLSLLLCACQGDPPDAGKEFSQGPLLRPVSATASGIIFNNTLTESPELNYLTYVYAYNGGGVAVGDVNNDGLQDIYFTGNQVSDRLYLNLGGLRFEDVTEKALGPLASSGWRNGVTMADVNADGWLDIYVCRGGPSRDTALTRNLFYQNNGDGTFTERAHALGIADPTHSTQAAFFDPDADGDLDLMVMNTPPDRIDTLSNFTALAAVKAHKAPTGRLYRNDGGRFVDITYEADVQHFIYGLGLSVSDLDMDGHPDLYLACDFDSPDLMYMNTGQGRFSEELQGRTHHTSNFGMGCDAADFNNDGLPDIMVLDMTADDHKRNKTNMGGMSPERFWANVRGGYFFQYMVNSLQLNNGNGTFSEIAQLSGIARTDWSWAPLFADLDNDGWKDLLVTNGFKHDVRNNDFVKGAMQQMHTGRDFYDQLDLIPSSRLHNYLFHNDHDLTFSDSSQAWGFTEPVNSNGAAYADLDNDGDLDLVINNLDDPATLFENTSAGRPDRHFLRLDLRAHGSAALGAKAFVYDHGQVQYQELYPTRGYQSCVEPLLHFGTGASTRVDSLLVRWPDGRITRSRDMKTDQVVQLRQEDAQGARPAKAPGPAIFHEVVAASVGIDRKHREDAYDDFSVEVLLPNKLSELGPLLGVGDANGDDLDDLFTPGATGQGSLLWLQRPDGTFKAAASQPWKAWAAQEHLGSLFFDADGDGDQDLLVLAGSNQQDLRTPGVYDQHLFLNDGHANFHNAKEALPAMETSAMRAAAADIDGDGDQDLYIAGRQTPGLYPFPPRSYLLVNDGHAHFTDGTEQLAPELMGPGMITAVAFADMDRDGDPDLVMAGEWMNVLLARNDGGRFSNVSAQAGLEDTHGWWSALAVADVNGDGHQDIIGGNLGWNSKFHGTPEHPVHVYWSDFDGNGRSDIVLAKEKDGVQLPVRGRECSSQQCPMILEKFPTYQAFAEADLQGIYSPEKLGRALHYQATFMRSAVFLSDGQGHWNRMPLPNIAQVAPINAIIPADVNGDGKLDLITAGNNWSAEVETVRYDAGTGLVLLGDGSGSFSPMTAQASGFFAWNNVKDLALMRLGNSHAPAIVVANNNDAVQLFVPTPVAPVRLSALSPK